MVVNGASAAQAATTTVDGSSALDLVDGSRLLAIESYHDKLYEITAGPLNTTVEADSSFSVDYNLAATYDPTADLVYFLTNAFSGCFLNKFDPDTSTQTPVISISSGTSPLSKCWGLTTLGGETGLLASDTTLFDIDLSTGAVSAPREIPCAGSAMAFDPASSDLYIGKVNGELYRADVTESDVSCTLVTTLADTIDGSGQNLKGFTFDTDGTLYYISTWVPKLFSLTPSDLTNPVYFYGDFRFTPAGEPLPFDSLVMIYTPLPEPDPELPQNSAGIDTALPTTGMSASNATFVVGVGHSAVGIGIVCLAIIRRRARRSV